MAIIPTQTEIADYFRKEYGDVSQYGWRVRMRRSFGYIGSQGWYESTVERLVTDGCSWIDVGGGKSIFPDNLKLSADLAKRAGLVVGVDPSENIFDNTIVHEKANCMIEDYKTDRMFDLATLRMVAEHVQNPKVVVSALARLIKPGGHVVIFTPNRWSPVSIAAAILPFWMHHPITNLLWQTREEDVFPTVYKMNTRSKLRSLFEAEGFSEKEFAHLDNCTVFQRYRTTYFLELSLQNMFRFVGMAYPENNLLGIYERQ